MSADVAAPPAVSVTDTSSKPTEDPFATQRAKGDDPFAGEQNLAAVAGSDDMAPTTGGAVEAEADKAGRRTSKEWDASKVKPSQFQKRKGSVFSTPSSRDSRNDKNRDAKYHEKNKEREEKKSLFSFFKKSKTPKEAPNGDSK